MPKFISIANNINLISIGGRELDFVSGEYKCVSLTSPICSFCARMQERMHELHIELINITRALNHLNVYFQAVMFLLLTEVQVPESVKDVALRLVLSNVVLNPIFYAGLYRRRTGAEDRLRGPSRRDGRSQVVLIYGIIQYT